MACNSSGVKTSSAVISNDRCDMHGVIADGGLYLELSGTGSCAVSVEFA